MVGWAAEQLLSKHMGRMPAPSEHAGSRVLDLPGFEVAHKAQVNWGQPTKDTRFLCRRWGLGPQAGSCLSEGVPGYG